MSDITINSISNTVVEEYPIAKGVVKYYVYARSGHAVVIIMTTGQDAAMSDINRTKPYEEQVAYKYHSSEMEDAMTFASDYNATMEAVPKA
jgi:hypothetical protein